MNFLKAILIFLACTLALSATARLYNVKTFGMEQGLSSNYVVSIEQDKHGFLWFATEEGLNRFDGLGFYTFYKDDKHSTITGNELNCLLDDPRDPVMWIATQRNGLDAYNYDTGTFRYYRHDDNDPHSMATNDVTSVSPSADGNIWITTYWKGADYLDKRSGRFTHYNKDNVRGLPDNTLWCLMDAGGGIVYLGHVRSGMSILDTKTRRVVSLRHDPRNPYSISSDEVSCIYRDRKGTIWVGTGQGLDVFDPVTHRFLHFTDGGRFGFKVMSMREMSDGRLWLATEMGGIAIIDNRGTAVDALRRPVEYLRVQPGHNSISGNSVRCIREDRYGNKWIGLYGEGVNLLSHDLPLFGKLAYSPIATPWSLTFKSVFGIATDAAGWLWAGTDGDGINVFDPSFVRRKEIRQGSGNSLSVQTAYRDSKGRMWFGYYVNGARVYSGGIARSIEGMDPHEDVRAFCEDRKGGYMFVGTSLGIVVVDMERMKALGRKEMGNNLVRTIAIDGKGRLWVGTFGDGRKPIMLIVEDNIDICRYIADSFAAEFEIVTAGNGRDGLKEAFRVVPDIIISDVMMPFMDGNEMCRRLKTDIRTNHIPIILLTAKDSMAAKEEGYLSGADSYITKPFVRSLIASRIDNLLSQRRLLAQAYNGSGGSEASGEDMNKKREMLRESLSKADKEFLAQIDGLIAQRMANDKVDVDWLSEQLNISPSTLYRKMKALTGLSTNEYVRKFSMAYAEKLLLEGRYTISEISYMVGMNTTAYFRKCFKEEYGVAPSEYLNRLKNRPSS